MHKSSQFTFVFKYFFPVFMFAGTAFGIYMFWTDANPEMQETAKAFSIMLVWISFFLVQMPFRLKRIEAGENGICIKNLKGEEIIDYKDIHWVTALDITSPWAMTIKYRDSKTGEDKKIAYMPNQNEPRTFKKDRLTQYIQEKNEEGNPAYSKNNQPSVTKNIFLIVVLGLPFTLATMYYLGVWDILLSSFN